MTRQLEYADSSGTPFVAIAGKNELERNVVKVKDMVKGKEVEVKLIDLIKFFNSV